MWAGWLSEYATDLEDRAQLRAAADGAARAADGAAPTADGAAPTADGVARAAFGDADAAVRLRREVIAIAPADYPDQPGLRSNLGAALTLRALLARPAARPQQAGADLAEAVDLHREAVRLAPAAHRHAVRLNGNLCRALVEQAERTGDRALLGEAVTAARRACQRARPGEEAVAAHALLIMCLARRAKDARDPVYLSELIDALEDQSGAADAGEAAERRLAAAEAGHELYWLTGDLASLTRAIEHCRVVLASPDELASTTRDSARFALLNRAALPLRACGPGRGSGRGH